MCLQGCVLYLKNEMNIIRYTRKPGENMKGTTGLNITGRILVLGLAMAIAAGPAVATTYYSQGTGNFTDVNRWNDAPDGSGNNYTADGTDTGHSFVIQSPDYITLTAGQALDSLIITDGGTLDMSAQTLQVIDFTVDGILDDTEGSASSVINISGNLTSGTNASYAGSGMSSIDFGGSGTQTLSGAFTGGLVFLNVTVSGSGTVDNNGSAGIEINGKFRQKSGTFQAGSSTYTMVYSVANDTCFIKEGGTFTAETSDFRYGGTASIRVRSNSDIVFYNFAAEHSNSVSIDFRSASTADTFYFANRFIRRQTANVFATSCAIAYYSGATLEYTNTGSKTASGEWPATAGPTNLILSGSAQVSVVSDRTVSGVTLQQTGGNLLVTGTGVDLTINGTLSRKTTGTVGCSTASGGAIVYGSSATLEYSLASGQTSTVTVGAEWTTSLTPPNVTINHAGTSNDTVKLPVGDLSVTNNLNMADGVLASVNSVNTLSVGGNVLTGTLTTSGNYNVGTLVLVGNQSQSISGGGGTSTVANLRINKTNTTDVVTLTSGTLKLASGGLLDIQSGIFALSTGANILDVSNATFRIQSGGTYRTGGKSVTITSATIDFQLGSTYEFNGTSTTESFITSGGTTNYGNVIINNTNATPSVTVPNGQLVVVRNDLTLTNGQILAGATNTSGNIEVEGTATSSGTSYVNGPLRIQYPSGTVSRNFPVGFSSNYRPAVFVYEGNTVATSVIEIEALSGDPGGNLPTGIAQIATSHYYTVREVGTGGTFDSLDLTLTYTGTGFTPDSRNKILIQSGAGPDYTVPSQGTAAGGIQTANGVTALPTNAFKVAFGAGSADKYWDGNGSGGTGNWSVAANWDNNSLPLAGDVVILDNSVLTADYEVVYDASTTATSFDNIQINGTSNSVTLRLDKNTTIDLTNGTTGLTLSNSANSSLIFNGTSIGMNGGGYNSARTSIGAASTVEYRTGTVYADAYGSLAINTTGSLTAGGAITVADDFTKSGSGSFDVANTTLSVTDTTDHQAGTISTSGTGSVSLGVVTNSSTMTISGSSASSFGAVTNSGSMTLSSTAGAVTFTGNYSGSGTISATSATPNVTFQAAFSPGGSTTFGSQALEFQGNVTVTGGTLTLSSNSTFTGSSADFEISGGSVASGSGTIAFTTGTGQTITGNVTFPSLTINNSNNVTISSGSLPSVTGTLTLTSGLVNFANNADYLTMNSASSLSGGSSTSYVNGKVRHVFATGSNVTAVFPVGKPAARYQPVTIILGSVATANPDITIEQIEIGNPSPLTTGVSLPLSAVSRVRRWSMGFNANGASVGGTSTATLSWDNAGAAGISDGIFAITGTATSADVVIAQQANQAGNWTSIGQSAFTGSFATGPNTNAGTARSSSLTLTDGQTDNLTFGATSGDVSLPVELSRFDAAEIENLGHIALSWTTESEIENAYWIVQRKKNDGDFENVTTLQGQGSKTSSTEYEFIDTDVQAGDSLTYRLADVSFSGAISYHTEKGVRVSLPERYELVGNFPNPFNPTTTITYKLPASSRVRLAVYNMLGQHVRTLVSGESQPSGVHRILWDGRNEAGTSVASGIYIYRLEAGNYRMTKRMLFLK